ncbi:chemotaxis protein CheC [Niveibacterium umoris]|uniref:Chemotaxis protein CheC n=1 Tax=Niveibacterium umoris TaxID=1193620 RepID=A0A840BKN9_9RHOO|nr:chemotaxis protein CheC [Niveibacterium umoris]MBB4014131.1 chemotaxis protein CheC [Niveibacterium umoris]
MTLALSELQLDALGETFNIALGEAASVFSQIVGEEVLLSVPWVALMPREEVAQAVDIGQGGQRLCGVLQRFSTESVFEADTLLVFSEEGGLEVVRRLLNEPTPIHRITELEQDALAEIGNIIINACMGSIAGILGREIPGSLPRVILADAHSLLERSAGSTVLVARIGMRLESTNIEGFVMFMMDLESIRAFVDKVGAAFNI